MRTITQHEAEAIRATLKEIASFANPAVDQSDGGQAAARRARAALKELKLFYEADANPEKLTAGVRGRLQERTEFAHRAQKR
jgi:hypothetical protein